MRVLNATKSTLINTKSTNVHSKMAQEQVQPMIYVNKQNRSINQSNKFHINFISDKLKLKNQKQNSPISENLK